ncbi:MAG: sulfotransferase [Planctomycetota bacterium]|nr:sulfotransferase [Planctomycetota bacterium]MDA1178524.1 sulfotransferase [Planctomycetota bacterium]
MSPDQLAGEAKQIRRAARQRYPWWAPRFWHGMRCWDWLQLLRRNGFRVHPLRWMMAASISGFSLINSFLSCLANWKYGQQIAKTPLHGPPIFIVGHWRCGTTYLHQLLAHDPRFVTPSTYECFVPNHFVISEAWLPRLLWFLMPRIRPMDDVRAGWFEPQEDEFALCGMGLPSPYLRIAFPQRNAVFMEYLDLQDLEPQAVQRWESGLRTFLQCVTFVHRKRLVLKSPTHTGRVAWLARMFPGAKFIHLVRHPYELYPSTMRLWQSLDEVQGLQAAAPQGRLQEYVLQTLERMYDGFWKQKSELPEGSMHEIRFEDLVADPVGQLKLAYDRLGLGEFQAIRPALEASFQAAKSYRRMRYDLADEDRELVARRWSKYMATYAYQDDVVPVGNSPERQNA